VSDEQTHRLGKRPWPRPTTLSCRPEYLTSLASTPSADHAVDRSVSNPILYPVPSSSISSAAVASTNGPTINPPRPSGQIGRMNDWRSPEGLIRMDGEAQHLWKTVRVVRFESDGQLRVVWSTESAIKPEPFPVPRSRSGWKDVRAGQFEGWGRRWTAPVGAGDH